MTKKQETIEKIENMSIYQKLSLIQQEFKANKSRFNSFGKYNFRSAEDILEALKPFNDKYKVCFIVTEEVLDTNPHPILKSTATIYDYETGLELFATAIVGVDLDQKGMQTPQQYGSASSYAKKYALGNLLLIDDTQDADATNKHDKEVKEELKWLNKNTPEFTKAIEYLKQGGSLDTIEKKYKLAKQVKDELLKVK